MVPETYNQGTDSFKMPVQIKNIVCVNARDPQTTKCTMETTYGVDFDSERTRLLNLQIVSPEDWRSLKRGSRFHLGIPTGQEVQNKIRAELVSDIDRLSVDIPNV